MSAAIQCRAVLHLENRAPSRQLGVLHCSVKRLELTSVDRLVWAWLCGGGIDWRSSLVIARPERSWPDNAKASGCSGPGSGNCGAARPEEQPFYGKPGI
jgi:hypothetical protein